MDEQVITIAPGTETILRIRCLGDVAGPVQPPAPPPMERPESAAAGEEDLPAPAPPAGNISKQQAEMPAQRKSRKNRKNNGATRKNRKQSGGKRLNPFMSFAAKERKNIMSQNPGMAVTEVGKELGKRWRALSEAEKQKY